ncbi:Ead-like protein [Salmonella enterica subsp. arizonae]|uniref:Ead-like protein n=1 Tax=Salmonella enterica subsp. arizonae TaxID=59203 RepID=A0A379S4P9_SALER|nr:Ead-like protein [Salmonella enterica subsp. arizonae]
MTIDKQALLGPDKHSNQHKLSRLIAEANSAEIRDIAEAVEQYTDQLIAALEAAEKRIAEQREYYEGVIADGSKRIAELEDAQCQHESDTLMLCHQFDELASAMGWTSELAMKQGVGQLEYARSIKTRIAELEAKLSKPVLLPKTNGYWTEQEKAYEEAITFAKRQVRLAGFNVEEM